MGRRPRIHFPGATYHVMARGVDGRSIYIDDHDREAFLAALTRVAHEAVADVLAYCLMGNHFHIAIHVDQVPLSVIMQRVLTGYSGAFNLRHLRSGHLFQARYKAIVCLDESYLARLIRYIHQNPVRAGLVMNAQEWPWSSFRHNPEAGADSDFNPWPKASNEIVDMKRLPKMSNEGFDDLGAKIAAETGLNIREIRSNGRRRPIIAARRMFALAALRNGSTLNAVAAWLQTTASSVTRYSRLNTANTGRPDT